MTEQHRASADSARDLQESLTSKGRRTRTRLLHAAREVFEANGYPATRVVDIATAAKVAHGTFYTYFDSKTDIFRALVTEFMPSIYSRRDVGGKALTRIQRIERGNLQFYSVYLGNVRLMALLEQAATFDDEVQELRIALRRNAERRIRSLVDAAQAEQTLDPSLDPEIVGSSLVAMTTHSFYTWHVTESRPYDVEQANKTLTYLWAAALGIRPDPEDEPFYQSLDSRYTGSAESAGSAHESKNPAPAKAATAAAKKVPAVRKAAAAKQAGGAKKASTGGSAGAAKSAKTTAKRAPKTSGQA